MRTSTKFRYILYLLAVAMVLHTIEELITKLYNFDPFIIATSHYFNISSILIYLLIQTLALLFIFTLLFLSTKNKVNKIFVILLGLGFLIELLHPYTSLKIHGYYPGLYTGLILIVIGFFYWQEVLHLWNKN